MFNILCDEKARTEVLDKLQILYKVVKNVTLSGCECVHGETGHFYFQKAEENKTNVFLMLELSEEEVWELDKFQLNLGYRKRRVEIHGNQLRDSESDTFFVYEKRDRAFQESPYHSLENLKQYKDENLQLSKCDVYLLIPGKFEKSSKVWDDIPEKREMYLIYLKKILINV